MDINMSGGNVTINGKSYTGNTISISGDGDVIIDGVKKDTPLVGKIDVVVNGDINTLDHKSGNIQANNVNSVKTISGDVVVNGQVGGDVTTVSGDVACGDVSGNVKTVSGDIN